MIVASSAQYQQWRTDCLKSLMGKHLPKIEKVNVVTITLFAPDKRSSDLSNKAESIMDLMVDAGIIEDDNWFVVPELRLVFGGVDKERPRAEILIE